MSGGWNNENNNNNAACMYTLCAVYVLKATFILFAKTGFYGLNLLDNTVV